MKFFRLIKIMTVSTLLFFISGYFLLLNNNTENFPIKFLFNQDNVEAVVYDSLKFISSLRFPVDRAPKSLLHSKDLSKIYVLCLEDLSVIEIDTKTRKRLRTLKFKPTEGVGFDYKKRKWVKSLQEKPVEGLLTHNDRFLWISLHNADGICVWDLKQRDIIENIESYKKAQVSSNDTLKSIKLPFFETETTPKFIAIDNYNHHLFVSNWHDNSITVIDIKGDQSKNWKTIKHIPTKVTPRGLLVDQENNTLWVGNMASHSISIIDLTTLKTKKEIKHVQSPRHFVMNDSIVIISQSSKEIISGFDRENQLKKIEIETKDDPRSLALSKNGRFLFCTSYADNLLEVFDLKTKRKLYNLVSNGSPVGVTLLEKKDIIEAWVCNYKFSTIKVFTFKMK